MNAILKSELPAPAPGGANVVNFPLALDAGAGSTVPPAANADFFRAVARPTSTPGIPEPVDFHIPDFAVMAAEGARHDVNFVEGYELFD